MNITHILLNNNELGKISLEQRTVDMPVWQTDLHNPSFAEYARLCGGEGFHVQERSDLDAAIRGALAVRGPSIVEIMSDPELI